MPATTAAKVPCCIKLHRSLRFWFQSATVRTRVFTSPKFPDFSSQSYKHQLGNSKMQCSNESRIYLGFNHWSGEMSVGFTSPSTDYRLYWTQSLSLSEYPQLTISETQFKNILFCCCLLIFLYFAMCHQWLPAPPILPTDRHGEHYTLFQGSQQQEVKFQDTIFRKFQDIFVVYLEIMFNFSIRWNIDRSIDHSKMS